MLKYIVMVAGVMSFAVSVQENDATVAFVNLHKIEGSGIRGEMVLEETAGGTMISGTASGLDPALQYISLAYDLGAVPSGPTACLPTNTAPGLLGSWDVNPDGTASLSEFVEGLEVGIIGAVSIRIFNFGGPQPLQSCGRLHIRGRGY